MRIVDSDVMRYACDLIKNDDVVACPTETVYGLFGSALSDVAVKKIYDIKGRPSYNPLIAHVGEIDMVRELCVLNSKQQAILEKCWLHNNWPITFVLQKNNTGAFGCISQLAIAGLDTIAVRRPNHLIALQLLSQTAIPLFAPSANTSNMLSPTSAQMVIDDIGSKLKLVLDGGMCSVGIESTIVDISADEIRILRPGYVTEEMLMVVCDASIAKKLDGNLAVTNVIAPGMLKKHYSPRLPLRINATNKRDGEAFVGFGICDVECDFNLSVSGDLLEAAQNLYSTMKHIDDCGLYKSIAIVTIPNNGIGIAINDRLSKGSCVS